jgi:serine beta-lactamase-like protein LACTB, mitochondrial
MKKLAIAILLSASSVTACGASGAGRQQLPVVTTAVVDSARKFAGSLVARERLPGFAVTVSVGRIGNPVVWQEGLGFADVDLKRTATTGTQFRIGSVSKLLTATVLMRLAQTGAIDLDAPIVRYLPELPSHLRELTLRQLAGHTAGVRHYQGQEFLSTTAYPKLLDAIEIFEQDSLVAPPGARYTYSSYGYNLIGAVLEETTGIPFHEVVRRHVLAPMGMSSTFPDASGYVSPRRAQLYSTGSSGVTAAPDDNLSGRWPSGGYLSTTDDMARLGRALLGPGLLDSAALSAMFTSQRTASGQPTGVGIGWRIASDAKGRRYFHHGGASNGGCAFLLVYPDSELVIAMASNAFAPWGERDALALASIFLDAPTR